MIPGVAVAGAAGAVGVGGGRAEGNDPVDGGAGFGEGDEGRDPVGRGGQLTAAVGARGLVVGTGESRPADGEDEQRDGDDEPRPHTASPLSPAISSAWRSSRASRTMSRITARATSRAGTPIKSMRTQRIE